MALTDIFFVCRLDCFSWGSLLAVWKKLICKSYLKHTQLVKTLAAGANGLLQDLCAIVECAIVDTCKEATEGPGHQALRRHDSWICGERPAEKPGLGGLHRAARSPRAKASELSLSNIVTKPKPWPKAPVVGHQPFNSVFRRISVSAFP